MTMAPAGLGSHDPRPGEREHPRVPVPAPSHCWRVFVKDMLGRTWAPIIEAADALDVRTKALAIYRGGTVLQAERMHLADVHAPFGPARTTAQRAEALSA